MSRRRRVGLWGQWPLDLPCSQLIDDQLRLYVVTGMHRSGTSALTELTRALGAWVGDDEDLLPPAPDNPRGFFEHREFKRINDRILDEIGGSWDQPPTMSPYWEQTPRLDGLRSEARAFLDELSGPDDDVVILKDPRASLTLPFWRTVGTIEGVIVSMRSPSSVAASLLRRNGMAPARSARLWWTYTCSAISFDPDALLVPYAELVEDSHGVATRVAQFLNLAGPLDEHVTDVIDPELDHGEGPIDDDVVAAAERVHMALLIGSDLVPLRDVVTLSGAASGVDGPAGMAERSKELAREALQERVRELKAALKDRSSANTRLKDQLAQLRSHISKLREDIEFSRARAARRELDVKDQESLVAELRDSQRLLSDQLARSRDELQRLKARRSVRAGLWLAQLAKPLFRRRADPLSRPRGTKRELEHGPTDGDTPVDAEAEQVRPAPPTELGFDPSVADMDSIVTVIVPVYDSPRETARCLDALARNTTSPAHLLLLDDASELDATRELLDQWGRRDGVTLIRNEENLGFTRTINRGLEACDTDVVILNSDTEVTPRWLEGLRLAIGSDRSVGTATAVSNDAGAFSVPVTGARNDLPAHLGTDAAGRALARGSQWRLPSAPTGNGFCMYIRRAVIDDVGLLDAEAFPVGYGEENDFCMRAGRAGWRHVVADPVLVRHAKATTFGERREALIRTGRAVVNHRYPEYSEKVRAFLRSEDMDAVRDAAARALDERAPRTTYGPRVLYVLHSGRGGTPATTVDLGTELSDRYDSLMLTCAPTRLVLYELTSDGPVEIERFGLREPVSFDEPFREDVQRLLVSILLRHAVELVHVRHLIKATLDVFAVARWLGIPYVVSFHDFYMACPTVHLLDDQDRFCAGQCTAGDGACRIPMKWIANSAPHLKHSGVHEWRELLRPYLEQADALITTSPRAREIYLNAYPTLDPESFHIIEHGRDLPPAPVGWTPPSVNGKVRLLVPGNLNVHKGSEFLRALRAADHGHRLEVHLLGQRDDDGMGLGISHGEYERDEFADRVRQIQPHLIGIFATWAETYNHTLSEAWMTGVPVVATDIGALGERIGTHGGGFLVAHDDPDEALRTILSMADAPDRLREVSRLEPRALRSVSAMGEDYDEIYSSVLASHRAFQSPEPLKLGLLSLGTRKMAPGSVQVRTLRPLSHPALGSDLVFRHLQTADLFESTCPKLDLLVVQRTAVPPDQVAPLRALLEARGLPLAVELDDLLFDENLLPDGDEDWAAHVAGIRGLMADADLVTVSTDVLADHATGLAERIEVLPNHLDERLWFTPSRGMQEEPERTRLLYVGSRTHSADLELLRPVLKLVREQVGGSVVLDVVGGTSDDDDWFNRIPIPRGCANYPAFAEWLGDVVAPGHMVALAPLVDTPFNRAKSDLKWLEYTAMGLPGVFSKGAAYDGSVTDGITGRLVRNNPLSWAEAIVELIRDPNGAGDMVTAARKEILATRTLDRRVHERLALYRTVVDQRHEVPA